MPYLDTPNNGGEYKAWATPVANYLRMRSPGVANGLAVVDCGTTGGDIVDLSRRIQTDNFKVKGAQINREVDTHFIDSNGNLILSECEIWIDTSPICVARSQSAIGNQGWAHVEQVENGIHQFVISSQPDASTLREA
jgi:hypothetical protein